LIRLASAAKPYAKTPDDLLTWATNALVGVPFDRAVLAELSAYLTATGGWTGSDAQLQAKVPGLMHLIAGSAEYQLL